MQETRLRHRRWGLSNLRTRTQREAPEVEQRSARTIEVKLKRAAECAAEAHPQSA
ncbi:hypothetical protein SBA6_300062 [Candidatus Sulfopaludibacter sp. SbA6]|nr:hypothetical protein SBA6_300062 [Candidatus Sulfopaludibacter sp. SbA6]